MRLASMRSAGAQERRSTGAQERRSAGVQVPARLQETSRSDVRAWVQEPARLQETSRSDVLRIYCLPDWQFPQSGWWRGAQLPIPAALGNDQLSTI